MSREATLSTVYGEFHDLLACDYISKGQATQKKAKKKKKMSFDEFIALR